MKLDELLKQLNDKKAEQAKVRQDFKDKEKVKALATAERLDRIEKLLGLDK